MSTLTDKVQALLTYANGISGKEDTTLGDAVKSLGDGFGGGGDVELISGEITPNSNVRNIAVNIDNPSNKTPLMALIICDDLYTTSISNCNVYTIGFNTEIHDISTNALSYITNSSGTSFSQTTSTIVFANNIITFNSYTGSSKYYIANKIYKYYIVLI